MNLFSRIKKTFARLIAWQQRPIVPKPLSTQETRCINCGETFQGNFCPRCGQSASTGRLSVSRMFSTLLDTWGLGTHSLLRTVWHLLARPGYMIGDYLEGRRQPYFPPLKTLLLVGTAYALVFTLGGGFSEEARQRPTALLNVEEMKQNATEESRLDTLSVAEREQAERAQEQFLSDLKFVDNVFQQYQAWQQRNRVMDQLVMHVFFALIAWRLFRKSPRRPRLLLSENVIAQVYICAQMGVAATLVMLVRMPFVPYATGELPSLLTLLLFVYDYKQLYGYGVWRTLWKTILMYVIFLLFSLLLIALVAIIVGIHVGYAMGS